LDTAPADSCSARPISRIVSSLDSNCISCFSFETEILWFVIGGDVLRE
jgi:hypothetical protein